MHREKTVSVKTAEEINFMWGKDEGRRPGKKSIMLNNVSPQHTNITVGKK